jgi:hypothetical protein
MSRITFIAIRGRKSRLSFRNEVLMELDASELLKIVRENENILKRFKRIISLLHKTGTNADKFKRYLVKEALSEFVDTETIETMSPLIRSPFDEPIQRAFENAKLNIQDPVHWHILMMVFCWSIFPPKATPGSPRAWTAFRYCKLLRDAHRFNYARRDRSDLEISKKFQGYSEQPETLRERLREAGDPQHNTFLAVHIIRCLHTIRRGYESRDHKWPPVDVEFVGERISNLPENGEMSSIARPPDRVASRSFIFELFNRLRKNSNSRLMEIIRSRGSETQAAEEWLKKRYKQTENELCHTLYEIQDYDAFLSLLERTVSEDVLQLGRCDVNNDVQVDQAVLSKACAEKQEKDIERLRATLAIYYCEQIAKGKISPSVSPKEAESLLD